MHEALDAHVVLRVDAHPSFGVGHLVRCLALAQEVRSRGGRVTVLGDLGGIGWLERLVADEGLPLVPPGPDVPSVVAQAVGLHADAVVLDGYHLPLHLGAALRVAGIAVLAMVDDMFGAAQEADLYVDQNLGALPRADPPADARALAGLSYALFRDSVRERRRGTAPDPHEPPRLLVVLGGTDPFGAAPVVVSLALRTGLAVEVVAVAARPELRDRIAALPTGPGQRVTVMEPVSDLAALAVRCDAAVSASGSSVWELLCLRVPTGVVCVADNQRAGYAATVAQDVVVPVGVLEDLVDGVSEGAVPEGPAGPGADAGVAALRTLIGDAGRRRELAARGGRLVDGDGRVRVVDALRGVLGR